MIDLGQVVCIASDSLETSTVGAEDPTIPSAGQVLFYLGEYADGWGGSSYGTQTSDKPREASAGDCN